MLSLPWLHIGCTWFTRLHVCVHVCLCMCVCVWLRYCQTPVEGEVTDYAQFLADNKINSNALTALRSLSHASIHSPKAALEKPNQLIVLIRGASMLPLRSGTSSKPYVKVSIGNKFFKTACVEVGDTVTWEEGFMFEVKTLYVREWRVCVGVCTLPWLPAHIT